MTYDSTEKAPIQPGSEFWLAPTDNDHDQSDWLKLGPTELIWFVGQSVPPGAGGRWSYFHPAEVDGVASPDGRHFTVTRIRIDCDDDRIVEIDVAAGVITKNPFSN